MLNKIFIQNYALIDHLNISLNRGLQVITGETGAGKSIILGALRLILGERADIKSIQNTENKSIIEVECLVSPKWKPFFDEKDIDFDENTIIRREILPSGKSRAFVNDMPVTLDILKELSTKLIDIHSQFETSNLFSEEYQFKLIDGLSENKTLIVEYQKKFLDYKNLRKNLSSLEEKLRELNKDSDYKEFLLNELEEVDLDTSNIEEVQSQLELQENAEYIYENLSQVFQRVEQEELGMLDSFIYIKNKLAKVTDLSSHFLDLQERMESVFLDFKDVINELENRSESLEIDVKPEVINNLRDKVNKMNALYAKHNVNSVAELIEIREQLSHEQNSFSDIEFEIENIKVEIENKIAEMTILAQKLSANRKKSAPKFSEKIEGLLKRLGLEKAKIEIQLSDKEDFVLFGKEGIDILFQANTGFPMKPIQTAISGGERSRVMLAVKKIIAENLELPTLILDEIDTGVSGKVADEIGKLMKEMATDMQLIVITHLAQVASKGNNNYKVLKQDVDGRTKSTIIPLSKEEKLLEIAQLLSGEKITEAALEQARELIG
jgi:DNA repair protein RecN